MSPVIRPVPAMQPNQLVVVGGTDRAVLSARGAFVSGMFPGMKLVRDSI